MKLGAIVVAMLAACGSKGDGGELHAVGTYVGGGSYMTGADGCTYAGAANMFADGDSAKEAKGPRFVVAPGAFTQTCGDQKVAFTAVVPTGAVIQGPAKVKKGTTSENYSGSLVADGKLLNGKAAVDWKLGKDCEGKATFAPVMGSQDTGGPDRTRELITTAAGTCTLSLTLTTGSALYATFAEQRYPTEKVVTIE